MSLVLIISDLLSVFLAFFIAYWLRIRSGLFSHSLISFSLYYNLIALTLLLTFIVFLNSRHYVPKRGFFTPLEFFSLTRSFMLTYVIVMALTFLTKGFAFSRLIIFFAFAFSLLFSASFRFLFRKFAPKQQKRVLIVGQTAIGKRLLKRLQQTSELGYIPIATLSSLRELSKYAPQADIVFLATEQRPDNLLEYVEQYHHLTFKIISDYIDFLTEPVNFDEFPDLPMIELRNKSPARLYLVFKRFFDFFASSLLLLFLSPLLLLIATFIKLTSHGPIIIKQIRVGYLERPFYFYKFRSMRVLSQSNQQLTNEVDYLFKKHHDPRVTFIGRCMRRFCLDELPQLFNVLKGDMSLVGPRPHFSHEMRLLKGVQKNRFLVKPGMTGLWQISGRHDLLFEKTIYLDLYYVKHLSFLLDLEILLKTLPAILFSRGFL